MDLKYKNKEQSNLQEYFRNKLLEVINGKEWPPRILHTDAKKYCSVITLSGDDSFSPKNKKGWINLYRNKDGSISIDTLIFFIKENAQSSIEYENYLDTIKIKW